jgi:hypothetical protein|tara:strand:- start:860 stop:1495 length:636 start_codon:yes stop_codon:yes gene_type:complete
MNRDRYKSSVAFIDLLFNITIGLAMLFIIAFLLINPIAKKGDVIVNAEFIITMSWPKDSKDDIDLYVMDPAGNIVYFRDKDNGLMHLDRDDLGDKNDQISTDSGIISFNLNEEHLTIRGIVPGEYIVNAHWYSKATYSFKNSEGNEYTPNDEIPVTIKVEKLNPYKVIFVDTKTFSKAGEEQTYLRFYVDTDGKVTKKNKLAKALVMGGNN